MTSGIMSPAFLITTLSPIRISFSCIRSSLCKALETVVPATLTGSSIAVGVTTPVLPILSSISNKSVMTSSAGNLYAIAQRGDFCV